MEAGLALGLLLVVLELAARLGPKTEPLEQLSSGLALTFLLGGLGAAALSGLGQLHPLACRLLVFPWLVLLLRPRFPQLLRACFGELGGFCLALWLASLAGSLAPTSHFDAQVYHYTLPKLYLERGQIYWTELGIYDGMFHGLHLLFALALGAAGETGANLLGPLFLLMLGTGLPVVGTGSRKLLTVLAWTSSGLFLQSYGGLSDLPVAAYSAVALRNWNRQRFARATLWSAVAFSMRLNGALVGLALVFSAIRNPRRALAVGFGSLVLGLPWMFFNWSHTGHPLYPIGGQWTLVSLMPGLGHRLLILGTLGFGGLLWMLAGRRPDSGPGWVRVALVVGVGLALQLAWEPGISWEDHLTPLLFPGLCLFLRARPSGEVWPACWALVLISLLPGVSERYLYPVEVWLLPLAAEGWNCQPKLRHWLAVSIGLTGMMTLSTLIPRFSALISREAYLDRHLQTNAAFRWLETTSYQKVLLTDGRGFRCPKPFVLVDLEPIPNTATGYSRATPEAIASYYLEQKCDLILWNFHQPTVAAAGLRQSALLNGGDLARMRADLVGCLDLAEAVRTTPELLRPALLPTLYDQRILRLEVLFRMTHQGRVVYNRAGVVAVEMRR